MHNANVPILFRAQTARHKFRPRHHPNRVPWGLEDLRSGGDTWNAGFAKHEASRCQSGSRKRPSTRGGRMTAMHCADTTIAHLPLRRCARFRDAFHLPGFHRHHTLTRFGQVVMQPLRQGIPNGSGAVLPVSAESTRVRRLSVNFCLPARYMLTALLIWCLNPVVLVPGTRPGEKGSRCDPNGSNPALPPQL
jgi:hypothetical protein